MKNSINTTLTLFCSEAQWGRWIIVVFYAIAMAWVESAVVLDVRTLIDRIQPYQPNPLPEIGNLGPAEVIREFATMIMLLTIGCLAGKNWRTRLAYTLIAFGVWDIFYYVFLKILSGWPNSLFDWDLLFLIPLPWWGPIWAPVSIALLMIAWGTLNTQFALETPPARTAAKWLSWCSFGMILALYVFMADALSVADQGPTAIRNVLPAQFNWPLFLVALAFMAAPLFGQLRQARSDSVQLAEAFNE